MSLLVNRENKDVLKQRLKEKFKPLGILAYSNCEYAGDDDFKGRENGIILFRPLENSKIIYVFYCNYEYLNNHLDKELKLIDEWASNRGNNCSCFRFGFMRYKSIFKII
jgi:hypothetical protein